MQTKDFFYELPTSLIAQTPLPQRSQSRLLVSNAQNKSIEDATFKQLDIVLNQQFNPLGKNKILLIGNNSKVYPARIRIVRKTGGRGEVFLLETGEKESYTCLLRPKSKLKPKEILYADDESKQPLFCVESLDPCRVSLANGLTCEQILKHYGEMPLPPYIVRDPQKVSSQKELDLDRYQTVYSSNCLIGSAAAPTAGLHFTPEVMDACQNNHIEFAYVTLHVGLGTFSPVQSNDIEKHNMHEEHYMVPKETLEKILLYKKNNWPIVFIGTTSLRTVESFFTQHQHKGDLLSYANNWYSTKLFIYPRHKEDLYLPSVGNGIITNFHQPESTLVMLIASLVGVAFWKQIYQHAIAHQYRFFSYGDSNLIVYRNLCHDAKPRPDVFLS